MRRPGFGSVVVRLLIVANAALWLLGLSEMLDVWGDAYTIPAHVTLPRATIWIVGFVLTASAVLAIVGFVQRQRGAVTPRVRYADWAVGGLQVAWAAMYVVSMTLFMREQSQPGIDHNLVVQGFYFEPLFALVSVMSAVVLFRDAGAVLAPRPRTIPGAVPGAWSAALRVLLAAYFVALLAYVPVYLAGWNHQVARYAPGPANVPWGPVFVGLVCALSVALLALGWVWRRRGAPRAARAWLRLGAWLQAVWCVLLVWGYIVDPIGLTRELAFDATQRPDALVALYGAFGLAFLAGLAAALHDRDARRVGSILAVRSPEYAAA